MSGNSDDVTNKPSYSWLFPTVTVFGLILFLALSFALYHRRLAAKRKKEEEYKSYFQIFRPDLALGDKRITRARSILTNTHYSDESYFITNENGFYNEAFEDEHDTVAEPESEMKVSDEEWIERRNVNITDEKEEEDDDVYLRSVQARKNLLLADVHSEEILIESDDDAFVQDESVTDINQTDDFGSQTDRLDTSVKNNPEKSELSANGIKMLNVSNLHTKDSETHAMFRESRQEIIHHKPPISKSITEFNRNTEKTIKNKTTLKPINAKKKKQRSLLSRAYEKNAISLNESVGDKSVFYSEPRRQSEPGLFLYTEEPADPQDANLYTNQNRILFNPYYTEISLPVNKNQKKRRGYSTTEDEKEIDASKHGYELKRQRSLPVMEDIYQKHLSASTWM